MFSNLSGISAPSDAQKITMKETLNFHINRLEREAASDGDQSLLEAMIATLHRMDRDGETETKPFSNVDQSSDLSFSDTFSESFLCGVQAAVEGFETTSEDALKKTDADVRSVSNTPTPTPTPTPRKSEKRQTLSDNWTPIHGIRRKAMMRASELVEGDENVEGQGVDSRLPKRDDYDAPQLDLSVDLFE